MPTLAQDLRNMINDLDARNSGDDTYRTAFSTFIRTRLRPGQTWRDRLVVWCEREEQIEAQKQDNESILLKNFAYAMNHWIKTGYSVTTAKTLATVK